MILFLVVWFAFGLWLRDATRRNPMTRHLLVYLDSVLMILAAVITWYALILLWVELAQR